MPDNPVRTAGHRLRPSVVAAVAAGGALGAPARYAVTNAVHLAKGSFPWATFAVNVSGSLALGVLLTLIVERWPPTRFVRPFVAIGFVGAYTTFSTLVVEADLLARDGRGGLGAVYVVASLGAGLAAVYAGIVLGRLWPIERRVR